ncbi:GntR family transcriptional regulator [Cryobacterium sp. Y57]|uniref:GntR family transcriptional regulator n=1 Tax=Cryobacterium sp. Y57 TaxID=2048287 RepID=UPI000CE2C94C|nr:GntR family transcriptional regulator [Cryobacterium sp. Y57]
MNFVVKPERELLGHVVASAIRDEILTGGVQHGEQLRLAPLAEKLNLSITPVREALLLLAQDGWVVHAPNRGFRVAPIRRNDVQDTYFIWATAEGELAARAAARVTLDGMDALREVDRALHQLEDHRSALALTLNAKLHSTVHAMADAPKLLWFADSARRLVPLQFDSAFHGVPGWEQVNRLGHTAIIDRIELGDADGARSLMRDHILATCSLLLAWLDSLAFWQE